MAIPDCCCVARCSWPRLTMADLPGPLIQIRVPTAYTTYPYVSYTTSPSQHDLPIPSTTSSCLMCISEQVNVPSLYDELPRRSARRMSTVSRRCMLVCCTCYILVGLAGTRHACVCSRTYPHGPYMLAHDLRPHMEVMCSDHDTHDRIWFARLPRCTALAERQLAQQLLCHRQHAHLANDASGLCSHGSVSANGDPPEHTSLPLHPRRPSICPTWVD